MKAYVLIFLTLLCFFSISPSIKAQDCGTTPTPEQMKFMESIGFESSSNSRTQAVLVKIPVKFNYVTRDDGTGGLSESQTEDLLSKVNGYFASSDMEFVLQDGVNLIRNSDFFDFDAAQEGAVAVSNDITGVVNIYFFNSLISGGRPLCGYTRFPPSSDRVFVAYNCVTGSNTTLEHELGHYFTLFHTHGTTNTGTTDELVDGSNCASAGDRLCDTPADPNLSGQVNASCAYTGSAKDANGDPFMPDVRNIMSYSPDACADILSTDQYDRMRKGFEEGRLYLQWTAEGFTGNFTASQREICNEQKIRFNGVGFGVTEWVWEFEGGSPSTSFLKDPEVTYNDGGSFNVKLTVKNSQGEEVEILKNSFIKVFDPLADARTDTVTYDFSTDLSGFSIENPDEGVTFVLSDVDKTDDVGSGSLFFNNFDYNADSQGNFDKIHVGSIDNKGVNKFIVSFDYAYTFRPGPIEDTFIYDSLFVTFNTGCLAEDEVLWSRGGRTLATAPETEDPFVPSGSSQWRKAEIEYQLDGQESAIFRLVNKSYNGNNLYIDNLKIIPDLTLDAPEIFRNAGVSNGALTLRWADVAFNELNYVLLKSVNGGEYQPIILDPNVQIYMDNDVSEKAVYDYKLTALGRNNYTSDTVGVVTYNNAITSLDLKDQIFGVDIYPNPTTDFFTLDVGDNEVEQLEVFDLVGNVLYRRRNFDNEVEVSTDEFNSGMIIAVIKMKKGIVIKKVIVK